RIAAAGDAEDLVRIILRNAAGLTVDLEISGGRIISEPECLVTGRRGALSLSGSNLHVRHLDPGAKIPRRRASVRTPDLSGFGTAETLPWVERDGTIGDSGEFSMHAMWPHL